VLPILFCTFAPVPTTPTDRHGDAMPPGVVARFGTVRLRADSGVQLTADGKLLVAVNASSARVFDRATGKLLRIIDPGPGYVTASVLHPNGKTLYTLHGMRVVASDLEMGKSAVFAEGEIFIANHAQLAVSADGRVLAVANPSSLTERPGDVRPGCVRLFNTATGKCFFDTEYMVNGGALALAPDGSKFSVGLYEELMVFDVKANQEAFRLKTTSYIYTRGAFSPDGKTVALFATHNQYGRVEIRDARTGKVLAVPEEKIQYAPWLRFSPDGSEVWCFPTDRPPVALDAAGKKPARPLVAGLKDDWRCPEISADAKWLAIASYHVIRVWDVAANREATASPDTDAWISAAPSPDGTRVATLGRAALAVWDAKTGKQLVRATGKNLGCDLRWTEDGKQLTACEGGNAVWWDAATGKQVRKLKVGDEFITQLTVRGNKVFASTWYDEAPPDEYAIDVATGKKLEWTGPEPLTAHWEDHVSPDGSRYVRWVDGGNNRRGARYALNSGGVQVNLSYWDEQYAFAFSPDGKRVVGAGKAGVRAWDAATGKALGPDPVADEAMVRGHARQVAVSPDARLAAVTIGEYVEHRQPGRIVETVLTGRTLLRVYDIATGRLTADLGSFDKLDRVTFMPDGKHLLAIRHGYAEVIDINAAKK
jgi:WD40 repeat protein